MFKRSHTAERREKQLRKQIADLESQLATRDRTIAVMQVELDAMAGVIARDRERVKAESAAFARQRAECEGTHGQTS